MIRMTTTVNNIADDNQCEKVWTHLREAGNHPALEARLRNLSRYEEWKTHLERGVGSFWTSQGERQAFFVAYDDGEPFGLVRVLRVPIYPWDRGDWGTGNSRGEIQDLLCGKAGEDVGSDLVKAAVAFLKEKGIEKIGASCWRPEQCEVVKGLGFKPFRRSILLGWRTDQNLQFEPKLRCSTHYVRSGEEKLVQEVFTSTWSFPVNFLPRMEIQQALIALVDGKPVGTVLMNNHSGSLDLGVQVVSSHRRKHVGSLLIREALGYYTKKGFEHMYVIRNLPVNGLREEDDVALQFYASTSAFPLREYVGFQGG